MRHRRDGAFSDLRIAFRLDIDQEAESPARTLKQTLDDALAEKASPAEDGHLSLCHC